MASAGSRRYGKYPDPDLEPKPKRRLRWIVLGLLLALVAAVGVAPTIVGSTSLRNSLAQSALDLNGTITIGSASFGWLSPLELKDVEIRDPSGAPVVRVARLAADSGLASLALHASSNLGKFTVENPDVNVVLREGGSNVEDTFGRMLSAKPSASSSTGSGPNMALDVHGGTVSIKDTTANSEARISDIQATVAKNSSAKPPLQVQAACNVTSDRAQPGRVTINLQAPDAAQGADAKTSLAMQAQSLPLTTLQALVRRFLPGANVTGTLNSDVNGEWTADSFKLNGQIDVSRLSQNVFNAGQTAPQLGGGRIAFNLASQQQPTGRTWQGEFTTDHLVTVNAGQANNWDRSVKVSLLAHETPAGPVFDQLQCDSAFLQLTAAGTPDDFRAAATCDLNALATELSQFVELSPSRPTGQGRLDLSWKRATDGSVAATCVGDFREVKIAMAGLNVDEPSAQLEFNGQWNPTARVLKFSKAALAAQTLAFSSDDLAVTLRDKGTPLVSGTLVYQGDLARLQRWTSDPRTPLAWQVAGRMAGQTTVTRDDSGVSAQSTTKFTDLAIYDTSAAAKGQTATPAWTEQQLDVAAKARFDAVGDSLTLDACDITSNTLRLTTTGKIDKLSTQQVLNLNGQAEYDWEKLTPLLRPSLGSDVALTGHETRNFSVQGPLAAVAQGNQPAPSPLETLTAEAGIGWTTANIYGLKIGKGDLTTSLKDGMLKVSPIDWEVSEGRLTFAPTIRLAPQPAEMQLPRGPVLTKVKLTPEMCKSALKFIIPSMADATKTEGEVSLEFSGGHVPLADAKASDLAGTLTVHSVKVSPGPGIQGLIGLAKELESIIRKKSPTLGTTDADDSLLTISDQNVQFRMVDGRVYHRGLEMTVGRNIVLKTQGSVGVNDETIDLLVEIPIPDEWIGADPLVQGFKGQVVQVPIRGNLGNYKPDGSAIKAIAQQMLKNTARGFLQNQLGDQLDKLLQPKR